MKLTILTTITEPIIRQDMYIEALENYSDLADEIVVVDGSKNKYVLDHLSSKIKHLKLEWGLSDKTHLPNLPEWNWIELPRHLNYGLSEATGDWVIKLDIDQMFHENDFDQIRKHLEAIPDNCDVATFQKMTFLPLGKYYQKGGQPIAFRNKAYIKIGKNINLATDLCFPIRFTDTYEHFKDIYIDYKLPLGTSLSTAKTPMSYWNYDYFFKTREFTKEEFWRFAKAYQRYFFEYKFGNRRKKAFDIFISMQKSRFAKAPYNATLESHSKYLRKKVQNLDPEQFGFNGWGLI